MTYRATPPWRESPEGAEWCASPNPRAGAQPHDPLRLCIYSTVALLGWLAGPYALAVFALLATVGYVRARRAGLMRSSCYLRDTRVVIGYLILLLVGAAVGIANAWSVV
ncbi:MAG: hypothetical protein Q4P36_05220 [Bowdeniella nasicola]|nr:hypothetical protein [Bowdeniella nasicola]